MKIEIIPSVVIDCSKDRCRMFDVSFTTNDGYKVFEYLELHNPSIIFSGIMKKDLINLLKRYYKTYKEIKKDLTFNKIVKRIVTDYNMLYDFIEMFEDYLRNVVASFLISLDSLNKFYLDYDLTLEKFIRKTLEKLGKKIEDVKSVMIQTSIEPICIAIKFKDNKINVIYIGYVY